MPDEEISDAQFFDVLTGFVDKTLAIAGRVADAYVRKLDREADDGILPGEYEADPAPAQAPVALRAKFRCTFVSPKTPIPNAVGVDQYVSVSLDAVSADSADNASWSSLTPSGGVSLVITNPGAFDALVQGQDYFLDLTAVPPVVDGPTPPDTDGFGCAPVTFRIERQTTTQLPDGTSVMGAWEHVGDETRPAPSAPTPPTA